MKLAWDSGTPVTLYEAQIDSILRVLEISEGWEARRALNQLGVHTGDCVRVLRRAPLDGPLVIECHGNHLAIGTQLAQRVLVEVVS